MRTHDFDRFLAEEKGRANNEGKEINFSFMHGWIYKTAEDLSAETMMGLSANTIRTRLKKLLFCPSSTNLPLPKAMLSNSLSQLVGFQCAPSLEVRAAVVLSLNLPIATKMPLPKVMSSVGPLPGAGCTVQAAPSGEVRIAE
jgi:hypothetical protein